MTRAQAVRAIAEMSKSSLIFSLTRTPPVSRAALKLRPQSAAVDRGAALEADAQVAVRVLGRAGLLELDRHRAGDVLDGQVAGDAPDVGLRRGTPAVETKVIVG